MTQELKKIRIAILTVIMLEVIAFGVSVWLFVMDKPEGFRETMNTTAWILTCGVSILFDLTLFWIAYLRISKIRQKSDLKAATLLGSDVQEAYNFGQLGLIVTDSTGIILWDSNMFKERNIEILDANIFELYPQLRELQECPPDTIAKVEINSRTYDVKYLQDAQLFIFKDSTEYQNLFNYSKDQTTVVGIIMLDNYRDMAGGEDDNNEIFNKVRQEIQDYSKDFNILLRRYRTDSYLMICNRASLERMEADKFSIISRVHEFGEDGDLTPTISIGIAYDFPDVTKLNEMASNAIDIALSRGGDQVVVSKYGEELKFYGGTSTAVESISKVKVRSVADSIIALIKSSSDVVIMGHTEMDMDALGACLGIKAIADRINVPAKIVYNPRLTERKTKYALSSSFRKSELDAITVNPKEAINSIRDSSIVVVCDVSNPTMVMEPQILEKATKVIVIDHHRRGESFIEKPVLSYIEPSASSASELISELIKYSTINPKIDVNEKYATIMLSGLFLDTNFFKSKTTGMRTFEAAEILKNFGADNAEADEFLKDEYEEFSLINSIISTMKTPYTGVVYCIYKDNDSIERSLLAKVANQVLQLKGVNAAFVIGKTDANEVRVSARSDGSINVQLITERMGGGGHYTSAAASYKDQTVDYVETQLLETLNELLNSARNTEEED